MPGSDVRRIDVTSHWRNQARVKEQSGTFDGQGCRIKFPYKFWPYKFMAEGKRDTDSFVHPIPF
jgi:hypothetical protein